MAPTLRRCAGRCPPRGLIRLGAARRRIESPALARFGRFHAILGNTREPMTRWRQAALAAAHNLPRIARPFVFSVSSNHTEEHP